MNQHERSFIKPLLMPFPISCCLLLVTWAASPSLEMIRGPHFHRRKPGLPAWHSQLRPSHHTSHASRKPPFSEPSAGASPLLLLHRHNPTPPFSVCVSRSVRPTLCDPMDCSPPGSSIHGILQARILEWVAIPFSRGSSRSRD